MSINRDEIKEKIIEKIYLLIEEEDQSEKDIIEQNLDEIVDQIKALDKLINRFKSNFELVYVIEANLKEKSKYDEFSTNGANRMKLRAQEIESLFNSDSIYEIELLTTLILYMSHKLKVSRYSVVDAVRANIESNY